MKLDYFDLLNPEPKQIYDIGRVIPPTLRSIGRLPGTYSTYQMYLVLLSVTEESYFNLLNEDDYYKQMSPEKKNGIDLYELISLGYKPNYCTNLRIQILRTYINLFSFFIIGDVIFDMKDQTFKIYDSECESHDRVNHHKNITAANKNPTGLIGKDNFTKICDIILQLNYMASKQEDKSKVKSKKAQRLLEQIEKAKAEYSKSKKEDKNFELPNLISALCSKHNSYNLTNVWELTVYQLYDQFYRQLNQSVIHIKEMNYAAYGGDFDFYEWFKQQEKN